MRVKKKIISLILLSSLLGFNNLPLYAYNFNDVSNNFWAYNYISNLSNDGVLSGYADNTFRPNAPVTRAEFATMIIKALGKDNIPVTNRYDFRDVSPYFWGDLNIQRAQQLGLVSGYPDGTFKPNSNITRTQVLAVLSKVINSGNLSPEQVNQILAQFNDSSQIQEWAKSAVAGAVRADLEVNYPNQAFLNPNANATRAEVAGMLFNTRNYLSSHNPASGKQIAQNTTPDNQNNNNTAMNNQNQATNMPQVDQIVQVSLLFLRY